MLNRKSLLVFFALLAVGVGITIAGDGIKPSYQPSEKSYYLTAAQASFVRPGLKLEIQKVEFAPPNVNVTFRISDDAGQGLDRLGVDTPGVVSPSFILARIRPGETQYTAYTTRVQASPITGVSATQAGTDTGGTYTSLGDGVYRYAFGTKLPAGFEVNATHTVGMYVTRNLADFGLTTYYANATSDFVPAGTAVTQVRDVVRTEACNQCHDPLSAHGGSRRQTQLCILCHQPQTTDPDTGNTVDFKVMIHKIHMGANLPSVSKQPLNILGTSGSGPTTTTATGATQTPIAAGAKIAGTPYQIIGNAQSLHDWSTVVWPQDVRNCTTCHQKGTQSDNYKNNPSRVACGSCHDDVDFASGKNHAGGVQVDDSKCSTCHPADTGLEFDLSVTGAHTIPTKSRQLAGLKVDITGVTGTNPGDKPTVSFKVSDNKGNPVDATKLTALGFELAGPTNDYTFSTVSATGVNSTENALPTVKATSTGFTYTFGTAIPKDAKGTYAVGGQAYRLVTIPGPLAGQSFSVRESANNPISYFGVAGAKATPRRTVVDVANCNTCHDKIGLHGASRTDTQYCVMCHNPTSADTQKPPQTVNFRTHIHRIHRGAELENDWTINGTNNFNGVRFPGDLRDCAKCHVNNSNQLPLPDGLANTITPRLFFTPTQPVASACLGCHDGEDAAAHAYVMTAPFGESCPVCHEEGADFAVSKVHAH